MRSIYPHSIAPGIPKDTSRSALSNFSPGYLIQDLMAHQLHSIAEFFVERRDALLTTWCERTRADAILPEQRLRFSAEELKDHLPALVDLMIGALDGTAADEDAIRIDAEEHGHTRRENGYNIEQLIWEFSLFRKLLRETLEDLSGKESVERLFVAREMISEIADRSEVWSIRQYILEAHAERDTARDALQQANEHKDRFMAVMSHELRNPLTALATAIHILKQDGAREDLKHRAIEIIDRQVQYQGRIVDDLLDVSRISLGKIELRKTEIDLTEVVERSIDLYLLPIDAKGIKLSFSKPDAPITLLADPVRVEQIISNLLNNALKFTSSGGEIAVAVERAADYASICVRDTGVGIHPDALDRIFELFAQMHPTASNTGVGIGLWLAKQLVEQHGGTIRVRSEGVGMGAEFVVALPLTH